MDIKTLDEQIQALQLQKQQAEDEAFSQQMYDMFAKLSTPEILQKLSGLMSESPILKMELKRLLGDKGISTTTVTVL